jgi:uncharacterized membrane protein
MKTLIPILGVVSLVVILTLCAAIMTLGWLSLLGHLGAHTHHPAMVLLIPSAALAILGYIASRANRNYMMRKLREKGVPEPTESERKARQFWTRATLATIFVVLLGIIWHGIRFWAKATAVTILVAELIRMTIHHG